MNGGGRGVPVDKILVVEMNVAGDGVIVEGEQTSRLDKMFVRNYECCVHNCVSILVDKTRKYQTL